MVLKKHNNLKRLIILSVLSIVLLSGISLAEDVAIYSAKCFKDGSGEIIIHSTNSDDKTYTKDMGFNAEYITFQGIKEHEFSLTGKWKDGQRYVKEGADKQKEYAVFEVNEAVFRDAGDYIINMKYLDYDNKTKHSNLRFTCAGMIFSCTLLNLEIEECKTTDNKKFEAVLDIKGINQSETGRLYLYEDIEYFLKAKNKYEDIKGEFSNSGSLPKGFGVVEKDGRYYLSYDFDDNFVYSFVAKFKGLNECRNANKYPNISLYSYKECDFFESKTEEIVYANESFVENKTKDIITEVIIADEKDIKKNHDWIIGILISVIVFLVIVLIIVLKKQKANKWWIK